MVSLFMVTARHNYRLARIRTCFPDEFTHEHSCMVSPAKGTHLRPLIHSRMITFELFTALFEFDTRFWQFRRDQHVQRRRKEMARERRERRVGSRPEPTLPITTPPRHHHKIGSIGGRHACLRACLQKRCCHVAMFIAVIGSVLAYVLHLQLIAFVFGRPDATPSTTIRSTQSSYPAQQEEKQLLKEPVLSAAAPERHPTYRLAFTVPWIGRTFPSWFPYFLASCRRSAFLVDWLIFHESAALPAAAEVPPNVIFHDLGRDGLGLLFGTKIASALRMHDSAARLVELFQIAFREFAYIVTEYKWALIASDDL